MITLSRKDTGEVLGTIEESDLKLLIDQLEEEYEDDVDYYINPTTIDTLQEKGASPELIRLLKQAVGDSAGAEVVWKKS